MDIDTLYGMYVLYGPTKISCPFQFIVSCLAFAMSCNLYLSQERIYILRHWYFLLKLVSCIILFVILWLERFIFILFRLNITKKWAWIYIKTYKHWMAFKIRCLTNCNYVCVVVIISMCTMEMFSGLLVNSQLKDAIAGTRWYTFAAWLQFGMMPYLQKVLNILFKFQSK